MKTCPACGASYSARISYCFEDGGVLVSAATAEQSLNAPPARHVPSRVATPVAPARRGRSLLAQKGGALTFGPPRATATPISPPGRGPDLSPAPLEPLDLPVADHDDLIAGLPMPTLDAKGTPAPTNVPRSPPPPLRRDTPTPVVDNRLDPAASDDDSRTFDDLDLHKVAAELGVGPVDEQDDEPVEEPERRPIPVWWFAVGAAVVVALALAAVFVGGAAGLLGSGALTRGADEVVVVAPPQPVADPPEPVVVVPPAPEVEVPVPPEPELAVAEVVEPEPPVPVAVVAPVPVRPAPDPAIEASPWGTLEVQQGQVSVSSVPSGGKVLVDGEPQGQTPTKITLPYGEHTVTVSLEGYGEAEQLVRVDGAKESVAFELKQQATSASFIIVLEGSVGAMLYVDGVKAGPLPARVTLSEGSHEFTVESPSGSYTITRDISTGGSSNVINLAG